jgi:cell division protein FtsI/penicillin-binding protein 2
MGKPLAQRFERRLRLGVAAGFVLGGLIVGRLVQVQVVEAIDLKREARSQQERTLALPAARGAIVDRDGHPLAVTLPADRRGTREADRLHPEGTLAAQVVGHCSGDGCGKEGIELAFEEHLRGQPGSRVVGANARGYRFTTPASRTRPPEDGATVMLTIDSDAQSVLERELQRCVEESGAHSATAVLMHPRTGDVFAMGSYPTYDPDRPGKFTPDCRRNRALTDMNEPGSTFKLVTMAACLEEGFATRETVLKSSKAIELGPSTRPRLSSPAWSGPNTSSSTPGASASAASQASSCPERRAVS